MSLKYHHLWSTDGHHVWSTEVCTAAVICCAAFVGLYSLWQLIVLSSKIGVIFEQTGTMSPVQGPEVCFFKGMDREMVVHVFGVKWSYTQIQLTVWLILLFSSFDSWGGVGLSNVLRVKWWLCSSFCCCGGVCQLVSSCSLCRIHPVMHNCTFLSLLIHPHVVLLCHSECKGSVLFSVVTIPLLRCYDARFSLAKKQSRFHSYGPFFKNLLLQNKQLTVRDNHKAVFRTVLWQN